nr:MAG TPA: hypothetical protein [Caudoviricetes sp.]
MRQVDADSAKRTYTQDMFDTEEDFERVNDVLNYAPTVDAVSVVRCQDCKNFSRNEENDPYCADRRGLSDPEPDGYCSYGERREE